MTTLVMPEQHRVLSHGLLLFCLLLLLAACAAQQKPPVWFRIDGKPVVSAQFEVDRTVCRGEMQKADLPSTAAPGVKLGLEGLYSPRGRAVEDVFVSCMAARGYLQRFE